MSDWLGARRVHLEECKSTNDEAAELARDGAVHGTIVTAERQSAGRGRAGRQWHSPPEGNLYLSCVLRPQLDPRNVPPITLAAGIGVHDALKAWDTPSSIKWPNDVLVGKRKLAGILTEMNTFGQTVDHVVLGIGVNVNGDIDQYPDELAEIATSIRRERGEEVDPEKFLDTLLDRLGHWLDRFFAGGVAAITDAWMERAGLVGAAVRTINGSTVVDGIARGLDGQGALLIEADDGRVHTVVAGDVFLR